MAPGARLGAGEMAPGARLGAGGSGCTGAGVPGQGTGAGVPGQVLYPDIPLLYTSLGTHRFLYTALSDTGYTGPRSWENNTALGSRNVTLYGNLASG